MTPFTLIVLDIFNEEFKEQSNGNHNGMTLKEAEEWFGISEYNNTTEAKEDAKRLVKSYLREEVEQTF